MVVAVVAVRADPYATDRGADLQRAATLDRQALDDRRPTPSTSTLPTASVATTSSGRRYPLRPGCRPSGTPVGHLDDELAAGSTGLAAREDLRHVLEGEGPVDVDPQPAGGDLVEPLTRPMLAGIGLIMVGVLLLELGAGH